MKRERPDYWYFYCDCALCTFIGSFVWVMYLWRWRMRCYFRHMKASYGRAAEWLEPGDVMDSAENPS